MRAHCARGDMDGGVKYVMFCRGPKCGEIWQDDSDLGPFLKKVAWKPKHGRTRHVYRLLKLDDRFFYYEYEGVQVCDKKMRWGYAM